MKRVILPSVIGVSLVGLSLALVGVSPVSFLSAVLYPSDSDAAPSASPSVLGTSTPLKHTYRINIPTVIRDLLTTAALTVEGDALIGGSLSVSGPVSFSNDSVFDGAITITSNINARGITMDLGNGRIIASNLVSTIEVGEGLSLAGTTSTPIITNTDLGSSQPIYKTIKVGDSTTTANSNSDTLSFSEGSGIQLSLSDDTVTITATTPTTAITTSGSYAVFSSGITRLGLGTSNPSNTLEVDPGTTNTSGITLTRLTSSSPVGVGGGKVLSVDSGGKIILVEDQTSTAAEDVLPITSTGGTLYFNGTNWVGSTNLYHNGGNVGISTDNPLARLHVVTNSAATIGTSIQGAASQTGDLLRFLNSNGDTLSFFDKDGIFNGSANLSGSFNPGLTTGAVTFQGASGLTGDASNLFWDNSLKRLGIGTGSPTSSLHVASTTNPSGGAVGMIFSPNALLPNGNGQLGLYSTDAYGIDVGGQLVLGGQDGGSTVSRSFAAIAGRKANSTFRDRAGYIQFSVRPVGDNSDLIERMRITDTGNVGIGTISPSVPLDVVGNAKVSGNLQIGNDPNKGIISYTTNTIHFNNVGANQLSLGHNTLTVGSWGAGDVYLNSITASAGNDNRTGMGLSIGSGQSTGDGSAGPIKFRITPAGVSGSNANPYVEVMRIDSNGNVGIGTDNPTEKLHVNGNIRVGQDSQLVMNGASTMITHNGTAWLQPYYNGNYNTAFYSGNSGTTPKMVILSGGQVGIGTTSPTSQLHLASTATSLSANGLSYMNWNPASAATFVGDLVRINVGSLGTITGNIFNITDNGSSLFSVSESKITSSLPHEFISAGDVSFGYDLQFTNSTSASVKSLSSLYLEAGPSYGSNDVVLKTFNSGNVVVDSRSLNVGGSTARGLLTVDNTYRPLTGKALVSLNQVENQDILTASASGTTRFVIKSDGKVGIRTSNPSYIFDLVYDGDEQFRVGRSSVKYTALRDDILLFYGMQANGIRIQTDGNADIHFRPNSVTAMTVKNGGNVGIGTTAPSHSLHIVGATGNDSASQILLQNVTTNNATKAARVNLAHYSNAEENIPLIAGLTDATNNYVSLGGGIGSMNAATIVRFYTAATNTTLDGVERMRITNSGNVGIGTTAPTSKLHVLTTQGGTAINNGISVGYYDQSNYGAVRGLLAHNGITNGFMIGSQGANSSNGGASNITFWTTSANSADGNTDATLTEKMRILYDGKVGIGTSNPSAALDIANGSLSLVLGANNFSTTRSDVTLKASRIGSYHYVNAEEPLGLLFGVSDSASSTISIGGGSSSLNAATQLNFYTAANTTTTTGTSRMTILSDGNVGIGTTTPSTKLHVRAEGTTGTIATFESDNNTGCTLSDGGIIACSSDERLKDNISSLSTGLSVISSLSPSTFTWKQGTTNTQAGFIAQAVENILPNLVFTNSQGFKSLSMTGMVPYIVKAIQEQQGQINSLSSSQVLGMTSIDGIELLSDEYQRLSDQLATLSPFESWLTLMSTILSTDDDSLVVKLATKFEGDVRFEGRVEYGDKDSGGWIEFEPGADKLEYQFGTAYESVPLVQLTPVGSISEYYLEELSSEGFVVRLAKPAAETLKFGWTATVVLDPITSVAPAPTPQASPNPPQPNPTPESDLESSSSGETQ